MADDTNKIEPIVRLELLGSEWEWLLDRMEVLHRRTQEIDTVSDSVRSGRLIGTLMVQIARHKAELWTNEEPRPIYREVFDQAHKAGGHAWDKPADPRKFLNEECR